MDSQPGGEGASGLTTAPALKQEDQEGRKCQESQRQNEKEKREGELIGGQHGVKPVGQGDGEAWIEGEGELPVGQAAEVGGVAPLFRLTKGEGGADDVRYRLRGANYDVQRAKLRPVPGGGEQVGEFLRPVVVPSRRP